MADIRNIPNVSNKALKLDKKEQNRIVEYLKTPVQNSSRNKNIDLADLSWSDFGKKALNFGHKDIENTTEKLREQLVKMISDQINTVEDKNVKNCAGLLKEIVADKLSKPWKLNPKPYILFL